MTVIREPRYTIRLPCTRGIKVLSHWSESVQAGRRAAIGAAVVKAGPEELTVRLTFRDVYMSLNINGPSASSFNCPVVVSR